MSAPEREPYPGYFAERHARLLAALAEARHNLAEGARDEHPALDVVAKALLEGYVNNGGHLGSWPSALLVTDALNGAGLLSTTPADGTS